MLTDPQSLEDLEQIFTSTDSPASLLEALMTIEGQISTRYGHATIDTEFLRTYYSAYFFALLLCDEIKEARMLSHRIPQSLTAADAVLQNSLILLRAVWNRKHAPVYQVLSESNWPDILKPLAEAYYSYFRDKTFDELSLTYEAIRPEVAASYLDFSLDIVAEDAMEDVSGSSPSKFIETVVQRGWEYDSETKMLKPVPRAQTGASPELDQVSIGQLTALLNNQG